MRKFELPSGSAGQLNFQENLNSIPDKGTIISLVKASIAESASAAKKAMDEAQESANAESKSSMGDKYETGRAMAQRDRDMYAGRYHQIVQDLGLLERLEKTAASGQVQPGSLVGTSFGKILIAVSLGVVEAGGETVLAVSVQSPLGRSLLGKAAGDGFVFQGKEHKVEWIL